MSLSTALADLYRRLGYATSPATDVATRLTGFLNEAQQDVLGEIGGSRLVHGTIQFASIADQHEYGLPPAIARILSIRDVTNRITLEAVPEAVYRAWVADPSSYTGRPVAYAALGLGFCALKPPSASSIFILSTDAADTTQTLYVRVIQSTGAVTLSSAVLTGTAAINLAADVVDIAEVYLSAVCAGNVTVRITSGVGTVMTTIYAGNLRHRWQRIALIGTPSSAITYTVEHERDATDLVNASDEFPVPIRFSRAVVTKALCYEYEKLGDAVRWGMMTKRYEIELGQLNSYLASPPDQIYIPNRGRATPSNLPSNYPSSGWGR